MVSIYSGDFIPTLTSYIPSMDHEELTECFKKLEESLEGVKATQAEAKGYLKAGMVFVGALNTLVLPALIWLFTTTLESKQETAVQGVRIERLEATVSSQASRRKARDRDEDPMPADRPRAATTSEIAVSFRHPEDQ
jgi:hypothetical protein